MKFEEIKINEICLGIDNDRLKEEIRRCETTEMAEIYIRGVDYLCTEERLILLLCGGIELSSVKLIDSLTEEIRNNPPLADILTEKILKLEKLNVLLAASDPELLLAVGELYETLLMYVHDSLIYEQVRKLYSKLKTGRTLPFLCKVKKIGSKAYYFANFETKDLESELKKLLEESEKRGTNEDVALCHFYLGLFLYKQPCFNEEEIYLHFSESQKQCCFASAPFISEFIEKYHSKYDCDIQAIWRARNGIEDDMEDNYNGFIFGSFDDEDLYEDDSFDFSYFNDDENCDEISTVPTLPDRQNCLSSTVPRSQTEYSENHLDEYSNNMPFGINDNLDPEDDDEYEPFDSPDDHIYFDYEEDIDDYEECKPLIDWSVPHNGGSSEDFL